jgi:uncharacterized membrane protein
MLHYIKAVDRQLLWLNLLLLLIVVFIPFPASLLGQHPDSRLAVALYGTNLICANATGTAMWLYATSRPHLAADAMSPVLARFIAKLHAAPIAFYAAAIVLAHWYVTISLVVFAAVPAFFIVPHRFIDQRLQSLANVE